jgi:FMN phosphatase YigB (HAD superfamily)
MASGVVVALDLGGVIVDVSREIAMATIGVGDVDFNKGFFHGDDHDRLTTGHLDGEEHLSRVARRLGRPVHDVRASWAAMVEVMPDGAALVRELLAAGHRVHLWSNTDTIHLDKIVRALPPGLVVETASFHLGAAKPSAEFFRRARALGEPALYLDDRPDFVAAAAAIGVRAAVAVGPAEARARLRSSGLL